MTPEEYQAQQLAISAAVAVYVQQFATLVQAPILTVVQWVNLLQLMFPEIYRWRIESSEIARTFYDTVREYHHPDLPRNDRFIEPYNFEWFVEDMEPIRRRVSQEDAPTDAISAMALRAIRSVENGGRRQIIEAVENDEAVAELVENQPEEPETPEPTRILNYRGEPVQPAPSSLIRGWARVATGRETCAWCLMLISRGPTYLKASTSGLYLDDASAIAMIAAGEDVSEYMKEWHAGCDCKVVPVFRKRDWIGREAADEALKLWNQAAKDAKALQKSEGRKRHPTGKNKGELVTHNQETINLLRRRLYAGEIDPADYAGLAA